MRVSDQDGIKKPLALSSEFEMYDWTIIVSYYSMYVAALAALARLGFKSKSHLFQERMLYLHLKMQMIS